MDTRDIELVLRGRAPIVVLETFDETRAVDLVRKTGRQTRLYSDAWRWSVTDGLVPLGFGIELKDKDKFVCIESALSQVKSKSANELYVFCDLHPFLDEPKVVRLLKDIALQANVTGQKLVLISHELSLPPEVSRLACKLSLALPTEDEISSIIRDEAKKWQQSHQGRRVRTDSETLDKLANNLRGIPHQEVRRLAHAAIADDGALTDDDLPELTKAKFSLMDMEGVLHFDYCSEQFSSIAGLDALKKWLELRRAAVKDPHVVDAPKGVMLLGVQGAGKSLAAKCIAGAWGLPLLRLDFATLYNKFIGETERNLREALKLADLMAPCVLWIDEIEKGLATDSDQGVGKRVLGTLLTWMNDRTSHVFMVATSNDVRDLPPELLRKGRFDELFFVDLPVPEVRAEIFRIHLSKRQLLDKRFDLSRLAEFSEGFSGAEIEQAVVSATYAASAAAEVLSQDMLETALNQTQPLSVLRSESISALREWARDRAVWA